MYASRTTAGLLKSPLNEWDYILWIWGREQSGCPLPLARRDFPIILFQRLAQFESVKQWSGSYLGALVISLNPERQKYHIPDGGPQKFLSQSCNLSRFLSVRSGLPTVKREVSKVRGGTESILLLGSEGTGLGVRATELAKRLGILQPAVSLSVRRGEEIGIIKINDFS